MLYKVAFWITCLLLVSTGAMAAPRASVRDGSQVGIVSKEMGAPASSAYRILDAAEPQKITASSRLGLPPTGNEENDMTGAYRFEAAGKPRNRSRDIPASPSSQDHAAATGLAIGVAGLGMAESVGGNVYPAVRPVPANLRSVLPQPAAPPVTSKQCRAPRPA